MEKTFSKVPVFDDFLLFVCECFFFCYPVTFSDISRLTFETRATWSLTACTMLSPVELSSEFCLVFASMKERQKENIRNVQFVLCFVILCGGFHNSHICLRIYPPQLRKPLVSWILFQLSFKLISIYNLSLRVFTNRDLVILPILDASRCIFILFCFSQFRNHAL